MKTTPPTPRTQAHLTRLVLALAAAATLTLGACATSTNSAVYKTNGDMHFKVGQNAAAITCYEQYLEYRPGDAPTRYNLAQAYMRSNEPAKAAENLRILHTQVPGNSAYTELLAESLLASGRRDELYRLLKSEAMEQQTMQDWLRLGNFALRLGDKDTALVALLASAKVDGGRSWQPQVALYDYYRSMGQRPEAIRRLRMAAWVDSLNSEVKRRIDECGEIYGPTFPIRPEEWDARAFDEPTQLLNPFDRKGDPASGTPTPAPAPAPAANP